jgi:3-deoxy-7-phosphoheptulonate synthase
MLIVMKSDATEAQIQTVLRVVEELGYRGHPMPGATRTAIGVTGNQTAVDPSHFENMPGVAEAIRVSKPYKLISLDLRPIAETVRRSGARFFRGGAYKPRTSPYAFQGLGEEGLRILADIRDTYGLKIVTEAMDEHGIDLVERYGDMIQIGARNMQNFSLLRRAGKSPLPILLKRGLSATLDEWLLAAEYVMAEGNYQVVLCERGIRTFAQHTRNTLDLAAIPAVRRLSHLPVIVDPSHGTGKNYMVTPLARAGVAVGADGLIVEVHDQPEHALSDGAQALTLEQYEELVNEVRAIHEVITPATVS